MKPLQIFCNNENIVIYCDQKRKTDQTKKKFIKIIIEKQKNTKVTQSTKDEDEVYQFMINPKPLIKRYYIFH